MSNHRILSVPAIVCLVMMTPNMAYSDPGANSGNPPDANIKGCWSADDHDFDYPGELIDQLIYAEDNSVLLGQYVWCYQAEMRMHNTLVLADPTRLGETRCLSPANPGVGGVCNLKDVGIDQSNVDNAAALESVPVSTARRFVWCHETGHGFGLGESTNSDNCMNANASFYTYFYNVHQFGPDHIGGL